MKYSSGSSLSNEAGDSHPFYLYGKESPRPAEGRRPVLPASYNY